MFYVRDENGIKNVTNDEVASLLQEESSLTIGINDYSIEFNWDGSFLYPVDRDDNSGRAFDRIKTSSEMVDILLSHGNQILEAFTFLKELPMEIYVSDGLNHNDYPIVDITDAIASLGKAKSDSLSLYKAIDMSGNIDQNGTRSRSI